MLLGDIGFFLGVFVCALIWRRSRLSVWGAVLAVPSFTLWMIAKLQLGAALTPFPEARQLVTSGLYRKIRHPVYLFSSLALVGIAICLNYDYFYAYTILAIAVQLWRIRLEERALRGKFGEAYLDYRKGTWF